MGKPAKDLKVLVVDDQNTMRRIIIALLRQIGVPQCDEADNGGTALAKLRNNQYDLIISDWNMEPMTGLQFLVEVRKDADPVRQKTPFIMITAESKTENVVAAKKAGVNNYIVKPFNCPTLKAKMTSVLGEF